MCAPPKNEKTTKFINHLLILNIAEAENDLGRKKMATFKLVISDPKNGKSYQREVQEAEAESFIGLKIKDKITGETVNLTGYEFEITGGSDNCGFPMRTDVSGTGRKKIFAVSGVGMRKQRKGQKQRKTVCGNTIHEKIAQINLKIVKYGKGSLEPKAEAGEQSKEAPEAQGNAENKEVKEEKPKEDTKAEAPAEKVPAEEKKQEAKELEKVKSEEDVGENQEESKKEEIKKEEPKGEKAEKEKPSESPKE